MKPILFAPTATEFDNNGLGALVDAPRCKVREERNGPYELEMDYPVDGQHFSEIEHSAIIYAIPADGKGAQPFRIYEISKPFDGLCTIYAEHISYQLAHIPVTPFGSVTSVAAALQGLKNNAAESCPYTFWTDKASAGTFEVTEPKSIRELLGGTQGSILDAFGGGEYEWDKYTVKLHQHRGQDKGVVIKYGRNLTDLKQEEAIDTTITGIYPFWADSESGTLVTLPEKVIHSANAGNFPYNRTVVVDASSEFQDEPTVSQLRSFANNYITQTGVGVPKVSIDISFAPLWQTEEYRDIANLERVNLCDTVTVVFEKLGVTASAKVVKTEYDVLNERYETIELGDARTNLAREVSNDISNNVNALASRIPTKNAIESIVDAQTALITGAMGGYIKIVYNAAGQPQELLFMDTDDIQTAVNVIRINKNGIGFSNDGYDPTKFVSAWTIDGKFSADFIATGHLLANYIKGGTLSLGGLNNGNGVMELYDANGVKIGQFTKDGFEQYSNTKTMGFRRYTVPYVKGWSEGGGKFHSLDTYTADGLLMKDESTGYMSFESLSDNGYAKILSFGNNFNRTDKNIAIYDYEQIHRFNSDGKSGYALSRGFRTNGVIEETAYSFDENDRTSVPNEIGKIQVGIGRVAISSNYGTYGTSDYKNAGLRADETMCMIHSGTASRSMVMKVEYNSAEIYIMENNNFYLRFQILNNKVLHNGVQLAYASSSSRRYKHSIRPIESEALDPHKLLALPIVQFEWNDNHPLQYEDMKGKTIPGIIAEDVEEIYPAATIHDAEGRVESWDERRLIPGMLALIQEQDKKIQELEARLEKLEEALCRVQ